MIWHGWVFRVGLSRTFRAAFTASLPVLTGYLFLGAGYGVLMHKLGYGPVWTALVSIIVFGGTIQYIATGLFAAGFQPLYAFVVSVVVNARHLFYGFSMLEKYRGTGWKKFFLIFWLTDETFSLVCSDDIPESIDHAWYRWFISGLNYCYWIVGGVAGNAAVSVFQFNAKGIEFVMTSLFTVIVVNQWRATENHYPAAVGVAASVVCLLIFGAEYFIIPSMILITIALLLARPKEENA